jgi:hypothetical protein
LISGDVVVVPDSGTRWNVEQNLLIGILRRCLDRLPRVGLTFESSSRVEQQLAATTLVLKSKLQ